MQSKSSTSLLQAEVMTMKDLCNEMKDMAETFSHDLDAQSLFWIHKAVVMSLIHSSNDAEKRIWLMLINVDNIFSKYITNIYIGVQASGTICWFYKYSLYNICVYCFYIQTKYCNLYYKHFRGKKYWKSNTWKKKLLTNK